MNDIDQLLRTPQLTQTARLLKMHERLIALAELRLQAERKLLTMNDNVGKVIADYFPQLRDKRDRQIDRTQRALVRIKRSYAEQLEAIKKASEEATDNDAQIYEKIAS